MIDYNNDYYLISTLSLAGIASEEYLISFLLIQYGWDC